MNKDQREALWGAFERGALERTQFLDTDELMPRPRSSILNPIRMNDPESEASATYASGDPIQVFDRNANARHMFLTPFAWPSWEPRFAIDSRQCGPRVISIGIELFLLNSIAPIQGGFDLHEVDKTRAVLCMHKRSIAEFSSRKAERHVTSVDEAAHCLSQWLQNVAEYPPQPWFDGGEDRGFQMFDVPYKAHPQQFYGALIVEPKWFEVHQ